MTTDLSADAMRVYDYVRDMITEIGEAPTLSEISDRFDLRSVTRARMSIDDLCSAGLLIRTTATVRNLALVEIEAPDLRNVATGALQAELSRRQRPFSVPYRVSPTFTRPCGAVGCQNRVQRGRWLCRDHWFVLPENLRHRLLVANRSRNEAELAAVWGEAKDLLEIARHVS